MNQLQTLRPFHVALADWLICHPELTYKDAAREFGCTAVTVGNVVNSDLFRDFYARRRDEVHGPAISGVRDRLETIAQIGSQRLAEKVAISDSPQFLLDVVSKMSDRIGLAPTRQSPGISFNGPVQINNNHPVTKTMLQEAREMLQARQREAAPLKLVHDTAALSEVA